MKTKLSIFFFFFVLLCSQHSVAQIIYENPYENLEIGKQIYFFEDKNNNLTIHDFENFHNFKQSSKSVHNFGITSSAVWLKIPITNKSSIGNIILQVNQPIIDEIELYAFNSMLNRYTVIRMGEYQAFSKREYLTPQYLFDLKCFLK
jgi:hypothetical protein